MSEGFSHRVLPYAGAEELLAGAVPFLRRGVADGDRVMAVTCLGTEVLLRDALGGDAAGVEFVRADSWYAHPSRTMADCLGDAEDAAGGGRRLRLLGEPAWTHRDPLEVREWQRAEAMTNVAFARTGAALLCPYPVRALPAAIVAGARKTHPETVRGETALPNPGYLDPWTYNAACDTEPLPPPPPDAEELLIDVVDLYWLRMLVGDYARTALLPDDDVQRLLVAVTEVMTNAIRHGEGPIALRLWTDPGALVCEVADRGRWRAGTGFGLIPPRIGEPDDAAGPDGGGRFGLWAVRMLCALVQIRTGEAGTVVRLRLKLPLRVDGRLSTHSG
nr:sensor histidine kinase [Actinomadura parmotrematis]